MRYDVVVTYRDGHGKPYNDHYVLDLEVLTGLVGISRKDEHDTARALEAISKTVAKWTEGNRGLHVLAEDYQQYAWANGRLIRHPRWYGRAWLAAVQRLTGRNLHPSERRRRGR